MRKSAEEPDGAGETIVRLWFANGVLENDAISRPAFILPHRNRRANGPDAIRVCARVLHWLVFAYLVVLTLLAGVITGLAPAAESFKLSLNGSLKGQESKFGWLTRDILIAGQVATSLVLLIGGALFARAEFSMLSTDPNFETRQVLQVPLNTRAPFSGSIEATLKGIAGVRSVCFTTIPPLAGKMPNVVTLDDRQVVLNNISPACFATLGFPIAFRKPAIAQVNAKYGRDPVATFYTHV